MKSAATRRPSLDEATRTRLCESDPSPNGWEPTRVPSAVFKGTFIEESRGNGHATAKFMADNKQEDVSRDDGKWPKFQRPQETPDFSTNPETAMIAAEEELDRQVEAILAIHDRKLERLARGERIPSGPYPVEVRNKKKGH